MRTAIYILVPVFVVLNTFAFRYQRVTLNCVRLLRDGRFEASQAMLTPAWIDVLQWVAVLLWPGLTIAILLAFNWLWALVFLLWGLLGTVAVDVVTPWPSYAYCFRVVKDCLQTQISASLRASMRGESPSSDMLDLMTVLGAIRGIERKHGMAPTSKENAGPNLGEDHDALP